MDRCPRCGWYLKSTKEDREAAKENFPNAFARWSLEDDIRLTEMAKAGMSMIEMMQEFKRPLKGIQRRLEALRVEWAPAPEKSTPPRKLTPEEEDRAFEEQAMKNAGLS